MKRLYVTLTVVICMACLIPIAPLMAVSGDSSLYTHFVYQFAHANILHWLVNGWSLLVLHNLFRPHRLIIAYVLSVLMTFCLFTVPCDSVARPLVGASVITSFFFGFVLTWIYRESRLSAWMVCAVLIIGFFIPGIAALPHLIMFLCGFLWYIMERTYRSFQRFITH